MDSTDWEPTAAELRRLQAEWRTVGAVRKNRSEAVWQRFRKACDHFFDRYKNRDELARAAALATLRGGLRRARSPRPGGGARAEAPADLLARVQAAQASWRQAGDAPRDAVAPLLARFGSARDRLVELWPAAFEGSDLDPEANRRKMEKLCARVEAVLQQVAPPAEADPRDLAARLKDALATNTMGGRAAVEARWQEATTEVESVQAAWERLGPVPGEAARALADRFARACTRFFEQRPRMERPKPADSPRRPRGRT